MVGLASVSGLGTVASVLLAIVVVAKSTNAYQESVAMHLALIGAVLFLAMVVALGALTPREWQQR